MGVDILHRFVEDLQLVQNGPLELRIVQNVIQHKPKIACVFQQEILR